MNRRRFLQFMAGSALIGAGHNSLSKLTVYHGYPNAQRRGLRPEALLHFVDQESPTNLYDLFSQYAATVGANTLGTFAHSNDPAVQNLNQQMATDGYNDLQVGNFTQPSLGIDFYMAGNTLPEDWHAIDHCAPFFSDYDISKARPLMEAAPIIGTSKASADMSASDPSLTTDDMSSMFVPYARLYNVAAGGYVYDPHRYVHFARHVTDFGWLDTWYYPPQTISVPQKTIRATGQTVTVLHHADHPVVTQPYQHTVMTTVAKAPPGGKDVPPRGETYPPSDNGDSAQIVLTHESTWTTPDSLKKYFPPQ